MELAKLPENIFSMSKKDIQKKVKQIIDWEIKSSSFDPLKVFVASKRAIEFFTSISDNVKDEALKEAQKYGSESLVKHDAKIDVGSTYTQYDFTVCRDEEYNCLVNEKTTLEAKIKEKEKFLKSLTKPVNIVSDDGELITVYPPLVKRTDGLKITY
jgi:hypothetical protein